jgi:ribose transport system substrate-binding protein
MLSNRRATSARRRAKIAVALAFATAVLTSVVAAASGSTTVPALRTVNLGAGPVSVGGAPLKIAFLDVCAACNAWSVANTDATFAEAKKLGITVTMFDANFNALNQVSQAKTAMAEGYKGMVIIALSPEMCTIAKQAVKEGIVVSVVNQHVCTSVYATGDGTWLPGTVNFIGGDQTQAVFTQYLSTIAAQNPGPQQVALVEGTPGLTQTLLMSRAVATVEKAHPDFKITPIQVPGYDLAGAYTAVSGFLPAHSNLTILASVYSDMTQGALKALQHEGKTSSVKVYDMGGDKWAFSAVKDGMVKLTSVFLPATEGRLAVQSLYNTWYQGKPGPHYVDILGTVGSPFVTTANISSRTPEY